MLNVFLEWMKRVLTSKRIKASYFEALETLVTSNCEPNSVVAVIIDDRNNEAVRNAVSDFHRSDKISKIIHLGCEVSIANMEQSLQKKYLSFLLPYKIRGAYDYNNLLMNKGFWHSFRKQKRVIIFQHDVLLLQPWSYFDDAWLNFDYIGAEWEEKRPNGKTIAGGCGGFSIRNPQLHLSICEQFSPILWIGGEDGYFAYFTSKLGGRVAEQSISRQFCCQFDISPGSFAIHKKVN